jgi:hypothetical protein
MNIEEIEKFLTEKAAQEQFIKIDFKKRDPIYGLFVKSKDFNDLKSKNFWRIVTKTHMEAWRKTKDMNLARIFSGSDFAKLKVVQEA